MQGIDSFLANIERFLRWIYPGLLVIVLLYLGDSLKLADFPGTEQSALKIFGLTVFAIVSSFVVYTLHRYVLHEIIEYAFFVLGIGAKYVRREGQQNPPAIWTHRLNPLQFWRWNSRFQRLKFGVSRKSAEGRFLDFLTYQWAVTHALGLTFWAIPVSYYFLSSDDSHLKAHPSAVLAGTILVLVAWVWQLCNNTASDIRLGQDEADQSEEAKAS